MEPVATLFVIPTPGRLFAATLVLLYACSSGDRPDTAAPAAPLPPGPSASPQPDTAAALPGDRIPAEPQRPGDPAAGYRALVTENYIGCGVPYSIYERIFGSWPERMRLPERTGRNAELPYFLTAYQNADGVEVVTANCLSCHAGFIDGKLIIGLGAASLDFSIDPSPPLRLAGLLLTGADKAEWRRFAERIAVISPYIRTHTLGANPGDAIAAVLFAHRDRDTLAWSDEALIELPAPREVPVDVPPWWHMKKKHAMFYTAAGRGDHARIMMTASALCTDSVARARQIDAYFPDIRAYIASLEPPAWPYGVDQALARRGDAVFRRLCRRCHGSYGDKPAYPNKVVALDKVGTDAALADGVGQFAGPFVDWFNGSFYGEIARLEPAAGYIAPPLDGIWASAPYLHNGAVPTLAALLDSSRRPTYWMRSHSSYDYDPQAVGWHTTAVQRGPDEERSVYVVDTTLPGYSNSGHTFADRLDAEERRALLEYLKTL